MPTPKPQVDPALMLFLFIAALGFALAPFTPEPHLFGKIRWVLGGAEGMEGKDWFDLVMHGLPITVMLLWVGYWLVGRLKG